MFRGEWGMAERTHFITYQVKQKKSGI